MWLWWCRVLGHRIRLNYYIGTVTIVRLVVAVGSDSQKQSEVVDLKVLPATTAVEEEFWGRVQSVVTE